MLPLQPLHIAQKATATCAACADVGNCYMFVLCISNSTPSRACFNMMRSLHSSSKQKTLILQSECSAASGTQCRMQSFSVPAKACFKRRKLSTPASAYQCWPATGPQLGQYAATRHSRPRVGVNPNQRYKGVCRYVQYGCTYPVDTDPAVPGCCQNSVDVCKIFRSSIGECMEGHADPVVSSAWLADHLQVC